MVGAYSEVPQAPQTPLHRPSPDLTPGLMDSWVVPFSEGKYFSSARLDSVRTAKVFFRSPDSHFCTGVLFQYENGGQRALGQCLPASDQCKEYTNPAYICMNKATSIRGYDIKTYQTTVNFFDSEGCHTAEKEGARCCHRMKDAVLYFWFSHYSTFLKITKLEAGEADVVHEATAHGFTGAS